MPKYKHFKCTTKCAGGCVLSSIDHGDEDNWSPFTLNGELCSGSEWEEVENHEELFQEE